MKFPGRIAALAMSLTAVVLMTAVAFFIDAKFETPGLIIGYLFPVTLVAVYFGSTVAFISALCCAAAATYFLFPPRFSFYIDNPRHIAELGFFILVALIGAKITALLTHDRESKARKIGE